MKFHSYPHVPNLEIVFEVVENRTFRHLALREFRRMGFALEFPEARHYLIKPG